MAALRKKWPGLKGESDERILAAEEWDKAQNRVRAAYEYRGTVASDIQDAYVDEVGQAWIAKNQTAYNLELARRLNAEADRVQALENTPGTLESKRAERKSSKQREDSAAAADKALSDDITFNIARVRELERQGRLTPAEAARLLELARGATDKFDAAMRLEGFVAEKQVAPSGTLPVGRSDSPANEAPTPNAAAPAEKAPAQARAPEAAAPALDSEPRGGVLPPGFRGLTWRQAIDKIVADHGRNAYVDGASIMYPSGRKGQMDGIGNVPADVVQYAAEALKPKPAVTGADWWDEQEADPFEAEKLNLTRIKEISQRQALDLDTDHMRSDGLAATGWSAESAQNAAEAMVPPIVREMVGAATASAAALRERVTDVRYAPTDGATNNITFKFDGKPMIGELRGRNADAVLRGKDAEGDRALAVRVLLDGDATPAAAPTLAERVKQRREKAAEPAPAAPVSSVEGQKGLAYRGSRIASLMAMNEQIRKLDPTEAWHPDNIRDATDLDGLQDSISSTLVRLQRKKESAAAPAATATHKDPGQPAEPATAPVIAQALSKAAVKEALSRSAMKAEALRLVDAAIATAKDADDPDVRMYEATAPGTRMTEEQIAQYKRLQGQAREKYMKRLTEEMAAQHERAAQNIGYAKIKVPGDGEFKVLNTKERLAEFRKKVESSPGFKETRAPRAPVNSANSKADAFSAMVEDGDLQAALDYAQAVGIDPKTAKLTDVLRKRLDKFMRDEEMAAAVAAREPAAPAPAPQPEVDAAPAAEPAAEAPALPNPWEISQDEFVRRVTFTKEGSSAFPWVAKWGDRILEAENEVFDHPDLGKTVVQGGRFSKTKREAEVVARGAHKRAVRRGVLNGNKATPEALAAYPDLLPAEAPAPVRDERTIELRKRASVLRSLRECLG